MARTNALGSASIEDRASRGMAMAHILFQLTALADRHERKIYQRPTCHVGQMLLWSRYPSNTRFLARARGRGALAMANPQELMAVSPSYLLLSLLALLSRPRWRP
jgi:hypothetical protein